MDLLSQCLEQLHLQGAVYRWLELSGAWRAPFASEVRGIHIVVRGSCEHRIGREPARRLEPLDYVIVPHGGAHTLQAVGAQRAPLLVFPDVAADKPLRFAARGHQPPVTIACGAFSFGAAIDHPVLESLPRLMVVASRAPLSSVSTHVESLLSELSSCRDGSAIVAARLSDVLLVHAIRTTLMATEVAGSRPPPSVLAGLRHPQIGTALRLMHETPQEPWTVELLARRVGLSRAAFAAHFREQVGEAPLHYLTRWRLWLARMLLQQTSHPLKTIAERTGYGSAASLSLAFKRALGRPPGSFRLSPGKPP